MKDARDCKRCEGFGSWYEYHDDQQILVKCPDCGGYGAHQLMRGSNLPTTPPSRTPPMTPRQALEEALGLIVENYFDADVKDAANAMNFAGRMDMTVALLPNRDWGNGPAGEARITPATTHARSKDDG